MTTQRAEDVIDPWFARRWWHALMANAVRLVEDSALLATRGSHGGAKVMAVLSTEELAKARHLYAAAAREWSKPLEYYPRAFGPAEPVVVPDEIRQAQLAENINANAALSVSRAGDVITSPLHIANEEIELVITFAARAIELHLFEDRARQQCDIPGALADSADELHQMVLAYAWPDEYEEAIEDAAGR